MPTLRTERFRTTNNTQLDVAESLTTLSGGLPRGTLLTCVGMPGLGLLRVNTNWMRYLPLHRAPLVCSRRAALGLAVVVLSIGRPHDTGRNGHGRLHDRPPLGAKARLPESRGYNSRPDVLGSSIAFCQIGGTIWATLLSVLFFLGLLPTLTMYVLVMPLSLPFALLGFPLLLLPPTRNMALKFIGTYLNYGGDANTTLIAHAGKGRQRLRVQHTLGAAGRSWNTRNRRVLCGDGARSSRCAALRQDGRSTAAARRLHDAGSRGWRRACGAPQGGQRRVHRDRVHHDETGGLRSVPPGAQ